MRETEKELINSLKEFCFLQYVLMEKTGNFGEAGKHRLTFDFARHILKLPADHTLSTLDLEKFRSRLNSFKAGKEKLSIQKLRARIKEMARILEEKGSSRKLFFGSRKEDFPILLFGPVKTFEQGGFIINLLEKEDVRSPAATLPIAAIATQKHEIIIRKESLEAVFWRKWAIDFTKNASFVSESELQNNLRRNVLSLYGVDSLPSLLEKKELFINEMIETTARHEIGHILFSKAYADQDSVIMGKLLSAKIQDSPLEILDEVLVEWMPEGVIPYLAKLAQSNYPKAKRIFYRYISDSWFYGNSGQEPLFELTDLFIAPLLSYAQKDGEIDFEKMLKDAPGVYSFFLERFNNILLEIRKQIEDTSFSFEGIEVSFSNLAKMQMSAFAKQNKCCDPASPIYQHYFWANMLTYLQNCSKDCFFSVKSTLQKLEQEIKSETLTHLTTDGDQFSGLREYIQQKAKYILPCLLSI